MTLQNLQAEFVELLLGDEDKAEWLHPSKNLFIYRNNIFNTLLSTLRECYPLVEKLVSESFFRTAARNYIATYPSLSSNLHDYGQYFSDFLTEYAPVKTLVYLPEVAKFEWLCHSLTFAPSHAPLDIQLLSNLTPEQQQNLRFILHPASYVTQFHYPILDIIELCQGNIEEINNLPEAKTYLLIIRRQLDVSIAPLSLAEFLFLSALQENKTLAQAVERAMHADANFQLDEKLPEWVKNKTIVGFECE